MRGSFAIENLDAQLCTHIVYAFAGLDFERDTVKSLGKLKSELNLKWLAEKKVVLQCTMKMELVGFHV